MDTIPLEVVKKTWKRMNKILPPHKEGLSILLREELLALATPCVDALSSPPIKSGRYSRAVINEKMLDYFKNEHEANFTESVVKVFANYNQPEILQYVIETLMEEVKNSEIRDENIGIMMIDLKVVIDCFDRY